MRIMNVKRAIIIFLVIGTLAVVAGCARWPDGPGPGPGPGTDYQLEITVEVSGVISPYNGIYYIGLDTDGQTGIGPGSDISEWEGYYYYVKFDSMGCYLYPKEGGGLPIPLNYSISDIENELQVTIPLSDLGDPESIDINVVATDLDNYTYDSLDSYFSVSTGFGSSKDMPDSEGDSGDGGPDFDITKVTAEITTLY